MKYTVTVSRPKSTTTVVIEADYFQVGNGHLVFRKRKATRDTYPETVHVFAPGRWLEVKAHG